ncbi:hypothetical protein EKD04_002085 [Chloroflexales bacterium ZM16-3]|nr:hypothetical protein [Chloroflexales bacterium ZM16-3]
MIVSQLNLGSRTATFWVSRMMAPLVALALLLQFVSYVDQMIPQRSASYSMNPINWLMLRGMYPAELFAEQRPYFRWTSGDATAILPNPGGEVGVRVDMVGQPDGTPNTTIYADGVRATLDIAPLLRRYYLLLPPSNSERLALRIVSPTQEIAGREIGVAVRTIHVSGSDSIPAQIPLRAAILLVAGYLLALRAGRPPWLSAGLLLLSIGALLIWHALAGWRYGVLGGAFLSTAAVSAAVLGFEQIITSRLPQRRPLAIVGAALIAAALPWLAAPPDLALPLAAISLLAVSVYVWLRGLGLPEAPVYGGAILIGVAAVAVRPLLDLASPSFALVLIGFSLSLFAISIVPRSEQPLLARLTVDAAWVLLAAAIIITVGVKVYIWQTPVRHSTDIYTIWKDSVHIASGQNPYEHVLAGNMQENNKYATYFPLFYLLGGLAHLLGLHSFDSWVRLWQVVFLICDIGTMLIIFLLLDSGRPTVAWVAAAFWSLSRWTLHSAMSVNIDFLAIFFLVLALALLYRQQQSPDPRAAARMPWGALLSLSVSLAVKQISIFMVPLFVIWVWNASGSPDPTAGRRASPIWRSALALAVIGSLPLLLAAPFLVWNAQGFILSIMFSVTRNANDASVGSLLGDILPGFTGITSRLPMLLMLLGVYLAAWRRQIPLFTSGLLTMFVFVSFNMVYFHQYGTWLLPLTSLIVCDLPTPQRSLLVRRQG